MNADTVLAFAALAVVQVLIPGPAVLVVLKSAKLRGRGSAILTALGVLAADLIWAPASVVGLTALLVSSQRAFDAIRVAGAAYPIDLGVRLIQTRTFDPVGADQLVAKPGEVTHRQAFSGDFLSDPSNPRPCWSTRASSRSS